MKNKKIKFKQIFLLSSMTAVCGLTAACSFYDQAAVSQHTATHLSKRAEVETNYDYDISFNNSVYLYNSRSDTTAIVGFNVTGYISLSFYYDPLYDETPYLDGYYGSLYYSYISNSSSGVVSNPISVEFDNTIASIGLYDIDNLIISITTSTSSANNFVYFEHEQLAITGANLSSPKTFNLCSFLSSSGSFMGMQYDSLLTVASLKKYTSNFEYDCSTLKDCVMHYFNGGNGGDYQSGYTAGYDVGYRTGKNEDVTTNGFMTILNSIFVAPIMMLKEALNFELFGVNFSALVTAIITIALVGVVLGVIIKGLLGGKQ